MKNYLMFALLIGAASTMAFGQVGVADAATVTVNCPEDECHVAPFFKGEGGFIGEVAAGHDEVAFTLVCGSLNMSATAEPSGGIVAQLLSMDNGLACSSGGRVEIQGLKDGGWYWINDSMNSAVASLVAKDALGNDMVMPTNPGSSDITLESMKGAPTTILKQASTGRIGILHHVLPEPPKADPPVCRPKSVGGGRYSLPHTGCMLGDGGTQIVLEGKANSIGAKPAITNGMVQRPPTGSVEVMFTLWGNGSGHISKSPGSESGSNTTEALRGWRIASAEPFHVPAAAANASIVGSSNAALESGGVELMPPGVKTTYALMPPGSVEDATTHVRELGHTDTDGTPDCTQKSTTNADDAILIWFAASDGGDDIGLVTNTADDTPFAEGGTDADVATWASTYNNSPAAVRTIELIRLPAAADGNATANDTDATTRPRSQWIQYPKVVCQETGTTTGTTRTAGSLKISASPNHCGRNANHSVTVALAVTSAAVTANSDTIPALSAGRDGTVAATSLMIVCPPASANQGQELVPDNPFPTRE